VLPAYDNDDVAECDSEEPGSLNHGLHAVRGLIHKKLYFSNFKSFNYMFCSCLNTGLFLITFTAVIRKLECLSPQVTFTHV
jgi:hypothetical protein